MLAFKDLFHGRVKCRLTKGELILTLRLAISNKWEAIYIYDAHARIIGGVLAQKAISMKIEQYRTEQKGERDFMPEVNPNNAMWKRAGRLNQKHHVDMTEEELINVASCEGIKHEHPCKNPIFRCSNCGNYGCAQEVAEKCSEQGFKNDKCLHCGKIGTRIPVMKYNLTAIQTEWVIDSAGRS